MFVRVSTCSHVRMGLYGYSCRNKLYLNIHTCSCEGAYIYIFIYMHTYVYIDVQAYMYKKCIYVGAFSQTDV